MPAEVGEVKAQGEACLQKVFSRLYFIGYIINV
jgi:hypothetical protein